MTNASIVLKFITDAATTVLSQKHSLISRALPVFQCHTHVRRKVGEVDNIVKLGGLWGRGFSNYLLLAAIKSEKHKALNLISGCLESW